MNWESFISDTILNKLTNSDPWTKYNTLTEILKLDKAAPEAEAARDELINHPFISSIISELKPWFRESITRHNAPSLAQHQLKILAEMGIRSVDPGITEIIKDIESHLDGRLYATRQTLPEKSFKLPDKKADEWHALPCDSPEIISSLLQLDHSSKKLTDAVEEVENRWLADENWFCHFFFVEKQFQIHKTACPMAGLMALDLFSKTKHKHNSTLIEKCVSPIVFHKDLGKSLYYFGRSKKFWTFKYPFIWYNALYLADVLTRFPQLHDTQIVKELINWIINNRSSNGTWKATSVFRVYKELDFGQKKNESMWITFLCLKILKQRFES